VGFAHLYLLASLEAPCLVGLRTRWIVEGTIQLTEVMARLQLATAAIASAEAVGMEGDLDDLMSFGGRLHGPRRGGTVPGSVARAD